MGTGRQTAAAEVESAFADELMHVVGRLRRIVRRRVRRDWPHRSLTESELEVLRLVRERPGFRVLDVASALGVAPNTVSTLVGRLTAAGLLERRIDSVDARAARLTISPATRRRFAEWRDRRQAMVARGLGALTERERRTIEAALPSLRRLVGVLEGE